MKESVKSSRRDNEEDDSDEDDIGEVPIVRTNAESAEIGVVIKEFEEEEEDEEEGYGEEEEEEEEEDGQSAIEKEEEGEFEWHFGGKIDPLAFAEVDANGAQPYQQFERFEYEALAARKRKKTLLLEKRQKEEARDRQQELFGATIDDIRAAAASEGKDSDLASLEDIWEASGFGFSSRKGRKRKRKSKRSRVNPDVTRKLGEANLLYAMSQYDQAIQLLEEIVRLAPNMPEPYHTLGLVYNSMGNRKKAINFYMLAAHLKPKDVSLWKRIAAWSLEEGLSTGQAIYCLRRAMKSDPKDVLVKWELASLFAEIKEFAKAAETYEAILETHPTDVEACKMAAKMRQHSGRTDEATKVLKKLLDEHPTEADLTVVNLLADLHMENRVFSSAIACIEEARTIYCAGQGLPLDLAVKAGISHAHLGNEAIAKDYCEALCKEQAEEIAELILQVADAYKGLGHHNSAVQYYTMLDGVAFFQNKSLWTKMSECHLAMKNNAAAVDFYKKILGESPDDIDVRIKLGSLLLEMDRIEEAVNYLSSPQESTQKEQTWWSDGKVVMLLAKVHYTKGKYDLFLEVSVPFLQNVFEAELFNQLNVKGTKRLPKSVLLARAKWLEDADGLRDAFIRFNPVMPNNLKTQAARARKALARLEAEKEERRAAVIACGLDWQSDEDDVEAMAIEIEPKVHQLPNLFADEEHFQVLLQTCKVLATKKRYGEALDMINQALRIGHPSLMSKRAELRALGAEITIKAKDAKHGFDCVRYIVQQQPLSLSAWNWYYQVVCSSEVRIPKHHKFLLTMRNKYTDCIPPIMIYGHQYTMISQPQGALREYLQAYKLQPEDPFINLCVGVSFINLSLGFRLTNRNQCVMQGFAFLHKYQQLSDHSQESNYNLARAYHHVGFVTIAVQYYEKVLSHCEKDHPRMNTLEDPFVTFGDILQRDKLDNSVQGLCDLRREAAFNLHLIYKKSGAVDLARQVLQDYCTL